MNEELIRLYKEGFKNALDELVRVNQGIIYKIAKKYLGINKLLDFEDLIQEGNLGLIEAIKKYDPEKEDAAKFITFAVFYINRHIHSVVNGRNSKDSGNMQLNNNASSLDKPINEEGLTLIDKLNGHFKGISNIEDKLFHEEIRRGLESSMVNSTTLQERETLKFFYGWDSASMTDSEIGDILGFEKKKVSYVRSKAIHHLRHDAWIMTKGKEIYYSEFSDIQKIRYNYDYIERKYDMELKQKRAILEGAK